VHGWLKVAVKKAWFPSLAWVTTEDPYIRFFVNGVHKRTKWVDSTNYPLFGDPNTDVIEIEIDGAPSEALTVRFELWDADTDTVWFSDADFIGEATFVFSTDVTTCSHLAGGCQQDFKMPLRCLTSRHADCWDRPAQYRSSFGQIEGKAYFGQNRAPAWDYTTTLMVQRGENLESSCSDGYGSGEPDLYLHVCGASNVCTNSAVVANKNPTWNKRYVFRSAFEKFSRIHSIEGAPVLVRMIAPVLAYLYCTTDPCFPSPCLMLSSACSMG
jgi:hypothetical protein